MRIIVSDYSGHPFQVQLSRALAERGHEVLHIYSATFQTPKGDLVRRPTDAPTFDIKGVVSSRPFVKDNIFKRRTCEIEIGKLLGAEIVRYRPDVVISSNAAIDAQKHIYRAARDVGARFVFWVQDLYGEGISRVLGGKLGAAGAALGRFYSGIEYRMIRSSDHAVVISEDFRELLEKRAAVPSQDITVIENWAPLADLPPYPRDNEWAEANLPPAPVRFIYSGTLGLKHDPGLLLKIAKNIGGSVIVFSEGTGPEMLAREAAATGVTNLEVRNWLPFGDLPKALAGGDVLIVVLEPDAGIFSVPSKVLTYLCAGRPILGSVPKSNLSARIITEAGAGLIEAPGDYDALIAAAKRLEADAEERRRMGVNARAYAEKTFDIDAIAAKFEAIAVRLTESPGTRPGATADAGEAVASELAGN